MYLGTFNFPDKKMHDITIETLFSFAIQANAIRFGKYQTVENWIAWLERLNLI